MKINYGLADTFFAIFGLHRVTGSGIKPVKHRESNYMATTNKKVFYGWGYESPKGVIATDVFSSKKDAGFYADDFAGYKLVKVQISKYTPKKK